MALYPLVIGGAAIIASIIGTFAVRTKSGNVERALLQGLVVSGVLAAAAFAPITYWLMRNLNFQETGDAVHTPSWSHLYLCSLIGIAVTALLFVITDYYTSTRFSPVKKTAKASITGHATNIIQGFGSGLQATALPAIVIVLGILGAWKLAGGGRDRHLRHRRRGDGAAVADRPDRRARRLRPDHRQRRRDRRDGGPAGGGAQGHRPRSTRSATRPRP